MATAPDAVYFVSIAAVAYPIHWPHQWQVGDALDEAVDGADDAIVAAAARGAEAWQG